MGPPGPAPHPQQEQQHISGQAGSVIHSGLTEGITFPPPGPGAMFLTALFGASSAFFSDFTAEAAAGSIL